MSAHFLFYFKFNSFNARLIQNPYRKCRYAGSNQFTRATPGDTIYIVTQEPNTKCLYLIARLVVANILPQLEAALYLSERPEDLWQASLYAVVDNTAAEPFKLINLMPWAEELRFISAKHSDRLIVKDGVVNPQQLQTARLLDPASAALLNDIWRTGRDELIKG
ncbi:MAG: hypothetical protein GX613_04585 [Chloroflexi bacterium]|nr:hypothetical protein [Chloroflexota bacterium]